MEIKNTDLRVGNYLNYKNGDDDLLVNVLSIGPHLASLAIGTNDEHGDFMSFYDKVSGIPLTEELLLKMGFEYWNGGSKNLHLSAWQIPQAARFDIDFIDGKIYLKSRYDQENLPAQWMPQIIYVHQVQNLYHILSGGQELTLS